MKPSKKMVVGLIRSLTESWKCVAFVDFDVNITLRLVEKIVVACETNSARVRGLVIDNGNKTLLKGKFPHFISSLLNNFLRLNFMIFVIFIKLLLISYISWYLFILNIIMISNF